jgi:multimeric flavodoxin WrbA
MTSKVIAIVGSYRKGGVVEHAVEAVLEGARQKGAQTQLIRLTEKHIAFCTNCRQCCQTPGPVRGQCTQQDDLAPLLAEIDSADALLLASSINYGNVTAIFRCFLERLIGCAYWPWGQATPKARSAWRPRRAVFVAASGMPGFLIPLLTGTGHAMKTMARMLGAKPVGNLWIGLAAMEQNHALGARTLKRAQRLGMRLV